MRPISRPSCLYCHRSSCRRMRTPCFYGLRRSLATRSFGRTWCGGAQIGTVLLPLASSTLRCYSIWDGLHAHGHLLSPFSSHWDLLSRIALHRIHRTCVAVLHTTVGLSVYLCVYIVPLSRMSRNSLVLTIVIRLLLSHILSIHITLHVVC